MGVSRDSPSIARATFFSVMDQSFGSLKGVGDADLSQTKAKKEFPIVTMGLPPVFHYDTACVPPYWTVSHPDPSLEAAGTVISCTAPVWTWMGRFKNSLANDRTSRGHVAWEIFFEAWSPMNYNTRISRIGTWDQVKGIPRWHMQQQTKGAHHSDAAKKTVKSKVCRPSGTSLMTWKVPKWKWNINDPWRICQG